MWNSYHSHSRWCGHGEGEIEEYVLAAIKAGIKEFALCEHLPDDHGFGKRMSWEQLPHYIKELERIEAKYRGQLRLIRCFEAEYRPKEFDRLKQLKAEYQIPLWILGQHDSGDRKINYYAMKDKRADLLRYTADVLEGLDTGFFQILAHPDLVAVNFAEIDELFLDCMEQIFRKCIERNVYVEINANGLRNHKAYPSLPVWQLAKKYPELKIIVSSDAHHPDFVDDEYVQEAFALAAKLELKITEMLDNI